MYVNGAPPASLPPCAVPGSWPFSATAANAFLMTYKPAARPGRGSAHKQTEHITIDLPAPRGPTRTRDVASRLATVRSITRVTLLRQPSGHRRPAKWRVWAPDSLA